MVISIKLVFSGLCILALIIASLSNYSMRNILEDDRGRAYPHIIAPFKFFNLRKRQPYKSKFYLFYMHIVASFFVILFLILGLVVK